MMLLGIVGFGNPMDPIMSGMIALVFVCPLGAIGGLVLGVKTAMRMQGQDNAAFLRNALAALATTLLVSAGIGGAAIYYFHATATPWLNPNAAPVMLQFEVRLPPGVALPKSPKEVEVELQTSMNRMPPDSVQLRSDGDRAVIFGQVELGFRVPHRQLEVKVNGQRNRVFLIKMTDKAPHSRDLSAWQALSDGSEIRYRAKWPGQDKDGRRGTAAMTEPAPTARAGSRNRAIVFGMIGAVLGICRHGHAGLVAGISVRAGTSVPRLWW